jgi:glycosyltransferase involved in cell wall biosynthesis
VPELDYTGVSTYINMLGQSFIDAGHNVHVLTLFNRSPVYLVIGNRYSLDWNREILAHSEDVEIYSDQLTKYVLQIEKVQNMTFDLILVNMIESLIFAKPLKDIRNVYAITHDYRHTFYHDYRLISVSEPMIKFYRNCGLSIEKNIDIPFNKKVVDSRYIHDYGISDYVLFPHRKTDNKGLRFLPKIKDEIDDDIVVLYSTDDNDYISFDKRAFPYGFYKHAKCMVQLAGREPAGYCILESLYFETPVYAFASDGVNSILKPYHPEWVVPYGNIDEIINLINNKRKTKQEIDKRVFDRHDPQRIVKEYLDLI